MCVTCVVVIGRGSLRTRGLVPSFDRVADELQPVFPSVLGVGTATGGHQSHPVSHRHHRTCRFLRRHLPVGHGHRLRPRLPLFQPHQTKTQVSPLLNFSFSNKINNSIISYRFQIKLNNIKSINIYLLLYNIIQS